MPRCGREGVGRQESKWVSHCWSVNSLPGEEVLLLHP